MWNKWFLDIYQNNSEHISEYQKRHLNVFCYICQISQHYKKKRQTDGRLQTTLENYPMILLWYLGTHETVRLNSDRFDVPKSTFLLHKRRLIDVFSDLYKKFVMWPNNEEKQHVRIWRFHWSSKSHWNNWRNSDIHNTTGWKWDRFRESKKFSFNYPTALCRHDRLFIDINLDGLDVSMMPGLESSGTLKFVNARHSYVIQIILQEMEHTHSHHTW